jgi:hypothetical protein
VLGQEQPWCDLLTLPTGPPVNQGLGVAASATQRSTALRLKLTLDLLHARAVFDLMGADPRVDDARWLLEWINRTNLTQFTRRDAHAAAPRGRFPKATSLDPALSLLEEHGYLRRVDADPAGPKGGRPPSPRFLVNPLPRATEPTEPVGG